MQKSVKIFISYKNSHQRIKSDVITPIQTGRAIADTIFDDMIGDDTGDNISELNAQYSELSAQYWIWKNYSEIGSPDYIGFMHYRRHFIFNEDLNREPNILGCVEFDSIDDKYIESVGLSDENIRTVASSSDVIVCSKIQLSHFTQVFPCDTSPDSRWAYCAEGMLHGKDYDIMLASVLHNFPEYRETVAQFEKIEFNYWCNSFIMKKEIFEEYCHFLFTVLEDCRAQIDMANYSPHAMRTLGYLGERLLTIFILHLQTQKDITIKEFPLSFIKKTPYNKEIEPLFPDKVAICMSSSNAFVPYLLVALQSLRDNSSAQDYYDIIIFELDISEENKIIIQDQIASRNISVRFFNMLNYTKKIAQDGAGHVTKETFFKIFMPAICYNYTRILCLDADIIIKSNIAELYKIDMKGSTVAAAPCIMWLGLIAKYKEFRDYAKNLFEKSELVTQYFQAGILLFDVARYNSKKIADVCAFDLMNNSYKFFDQCTLNKFLANDSIRLGYSWNYEITTTFFDQILKHAPASHIDLRNEARKHINIIHYNGHEKPWHYPYNEFSYVWWRYARKTPFYEKLLIDLMTLTLPQKTLPSFKLKNIFKYFRYRLLSHITIGKTRQYYQEKKKKIKKQLVAVL